MALTCINNLIGLTQSNCGCHDGSKPSNFEELNKSESGIYLTDPDYGFPLLPVVLAAINCEGGDSIWDVLVNMRSLAIDAFERDISVALGARYKERVHSFDGEIGQRNGTASSVNLTHTYAGVQLRPVRLKDGFFTITAIYAGFKDTGTVTLKFQANNPDFSQDDISLDTVAGQFHKNELANPIKLPFYSSGIQSSLRYNLYTQPGSNLPLNNTFYCCGGKPAWTNQLRAGGFQVNNDADLVNHNYGASAAYGIVLEGYMGCDITNWVCSAQKIGGYSLQQTVARAIQFKAAANLIQFVLDSPNISYYTTLKRESLYGKRASRLKDYMTNIDWLASRLPQGATDCYRCKEPFAIITSF